MAAVVQRLHGCAQGQEQFSSKERERRDKA